MTEVRTAICVAALTLVAACGREPVEWACPDVGDGDLVLTEIRGSQQEVDGADWIEIYNASGADVDLHGLHAYIRRLDGSNPRTIIVRDRDVVVGAGDYAVLGGVSRDATPEHVDYGYADDFPVDLYDTAAVDLLACDEEIDQIVYRNLPGDGTHALDGSIDPDTERNSDDAYWCTDARLSADGERVGTPGEHNRACPGESSDDSGEGRGGDDV